THVIISPLKKIFRLHTFVLLPARSKLTDERTSQNSVNPHLFDDGEFCLVFLFGQGWHQRELEKRLPVFHTTPCCAKGESSFHGTSHASSIDTSLKSWTSSTTTGKSLHCGAIDNYGMIDFHEPERALARMSILTLSNTEKTGSDYNRGSPQQPKFYE
ncbi:MAG: hypothetical protein ACM32O_12890, partial [Clostridia bacterium]